jgi:hypothetical protein
MTVTWRAVFGGMVGTSALGIGRYSVGMICICGKNFKPTRKNQRHHSAACRKLAYEKDEKAAARRKRYASSEKGIATQQRYQATGVTAANSRAYRARGAMWGRQFMTAIKAMPAMDNLKMLQPQTIWTRKQVREISVPSLDEWIKRHRSRRAFFGYWELLDEFYDRLFAAIHDAS